MNAKFLLSIFICLIAAFAASNAAEPLLVSFEGRNAKTNEKVTLDSIRIVEINSLKTWVITKDTIDISQLNSNQEITASNQFQFKTGNKAFLSIEGKLQISINLPYSSNLSLGLFDMVGNKLCCFDENLGAGLHDFTISKGPTADGIYFLSANNGKYATCVAVMMLGDAASAEPYIDYKGISSTCGNDFGISIQSTSYEFTGYAKGYKPSTISNAIPLGGENYLFVFEYSYDFKTCSIELDSLKILLNENYYYYYYGENSFSDTSYIDTIHWEVEVYNRRGDSTELAKAKSNYLFLLYDCDTIYSHINNTYKFCYHYIEGYMYDYNIEGKIVEVTIDTSTNEIKSLVYEHKYKDFWENSYPSTQNETTIESKLIVNNINYEIKNGVIFGYISGEAVINSLKAILLNYLNYNRQLNSGQSKSVEYLKVDSINPDAYIKITLSP